MSTRDPAGPWRSYIAGEWRSGGGRRRHEVVDPGARGTVSSVCELATGDDIDDAVAAAGDAFEEWRHTPAPERSAYLDRFVARWESRIPEVAEVVTREMGKPLSEAQGEARRAIDELRFVAGEGYRLSERTFPSTRRNVAAAIERQPLGVVVAITPWNFPILSPLRKVAPALVAGCPVVLKPALEAPGASAIIAELFDELGLPPGVFGLVLGGGSDTGEPLALHEGVQGITFTGSTEVGLHLAGQAAARNRRVQLEMGGKNGAVVTECADMERVADEIVRAAFAANGQRCTALSRVIATPARREELQRLLSERIARLRLGHGMEEGADIGPLVSQEAVERCQRYVDQAIRSGARALVGGGRPDALAEGNYFQPTLLVDVPRRTPPALDEIFGPVLVMISAADFAEALDIHNETSYGLTSSVFTDDVHEARTFSAEAEAGMVHVNHGTTSEGHVPFGGVKDSGQGAYGIGDTNQEFYTVRKVVYDMYQPPL